MKKLTVLFLTLLLVLSAPAGIFARVGLPDAIAPVAEALSPRDYGWVNIETDWELDANDRIAVKVYFMDSVDLKSWDLWFYYDTEIFYRSKMVAGKDAKQIMSFCDPAENSFTQELQDNYYNEGENKIGGYFKEVLWPAEDFLAASLPDESCIIDETKFEAVIIYLFVRDPAAFDAVSTEISISGNMTFAEGTTVSDSETKEAVQLGDIDGDGYLTAEDVRRVQRAAIGLDLLTNEQILVADADGNGTVSAADARLLLRTVVRLDYPYSDVAPNMPILAPSSDPDAPIVTIETDWTVDRYNTIAVKVYFAYAIGLTAWELQIEYDPSVFNYYSHSTGADAKQVQSFCEYTKNRITSECNGVEDGKISYSGYFMEELWTSEEFLDNSVLDGDCIVNDEKFEAVVFYLEVEDAEAFATALVNISVAGNLCRNSVFTGTDDRIERVLVCTHKNVNTTTVPATCISTGSMESECADCTMPLDLVILPVDPDHHAGDTITGATISEPTERLPGLQEILCADCGAVIETAEIPPTDCIAYGMCGDNLHWVLKTDGTLYIFGTGEMYDFKVKGASEAAWEAYIDSVKKVIVEEGATSIGDGAFYHNDNAAGLTQVIIADSVTTIGMDAFCNCELLTTVTFGENSQLTEIGSYAFSSCIALCDIEIPDSVTDIGSFAFEGCESLTSVSFGENNQLNFIAAYVFSGCVSLCDIVIPDSVTGIGISAFAWCESLTSVAIPDTVEYIADSAFMRCTSLTTVTFGADSMLTEIGRSAFAHCGVLNDFDMPDSVEYIGSGAFINCAALQELSIPDAVTEIVYSTFSGCTSLENITIPDRVTSIGYDAFYDCASLEEITIPVATQSIDECAFDGCTALQKITILNPDCEIYDAAETISDTAVIRGYLASTAQVYAETYGRTFESIDSELLMGDIDDDGMITAGDARIALRYSVGLENLNIRQLTVGDVNNDGEVNAGDARLILRWSVGMFEE